MSEGSKVFNGTGGSDGGAAAWAAGRWQSAAALPAFRLAVQVGHMLCLASTHAATMLTNTSPSLLSLFSSFSLGRGRHHGHHGHLLANRGL